MLGKLSQVSIGKQVSFADPTTLDRQSLNVYSVNGGQSDNFVDDPILGGGLNNGSDPSAPAPGLDDHKVTIKAPLCVDQAPFWFAAFFGAEAASGSTPNYTHEWKSGQALPIIFLEHQLKAGVYRRHFGMIGESMTIDLDSEREGFAMMELTFVGLKDAKAAIAMPGDVDAAPALNRAAQKLVNIVYNGVSGGYLIGGKFTFTRKLKRHRSADGTGLPYSVEQDGDSTLTGSLRTRFENDTFVDDGIAQTERALELQLMKTAQRGLQFDMQHMRLNRTPVSVDGPDGIEVNFDFRAWQTTADAALAARALNAQATVALP